jgi:hypothetical protein
MRRALLAHAVLASLFLGIGVANAGELPEDIWSGKHGGHPSITANNGGVSITLPSQAVADAGGGSMAKLAQGFLEKYAPGMCSDVFDFQSPHKGLKVKVALTERVDIGIPFLHYYEVSPTYGEVEFDYTPSRAVKCVSPEPRTS